MIGLAQAYQLLGARLGDTDRARHSVFVSYAMRHLARLLDGDEEMWQVVGLCHDLDYYETADDRSRHGVLAAQWLEHALPVEALDAIRAHDHRTGFRPQTILADALKLADALAIADASLGRERMAMLRSANAEAELRTSLAERPYLPEIIVDLSRRNGVSLGQLAEICDAAPPQG